MFRMVVGVAAVALSLLAGSGSAGGQPPSYFEQIGYTDLQNRLGAATPTGAGILVSQIEAQEGAGAYLPDPTAFTGKTIIDRTGGGTASGHATTVGQLFYGNQSIAPGVTQINAYGVGTSLPGDWLGGGYLRAGTTLAPLVDPARVQNHSYVADTSPSDPAAIEILRRLDFAIARDNIVVVVGVNNGTGSVPSLQASGYNSIAVGLTGGGSSIGPTATDGAGRSKPDIVVPLGFTSFGTPVVSASSALLVQTAAAKANPAEAAAAGRVETIKAALLSGATTSQFAGLAEPWHRTNNGNFVEPLDRRFGAGQLNINNSHLILSAAQQNGTDLVADARTGWDFGTLTSVGQVRRYYFDAPADAGTVTLSATVTWLRQIPQSGSVFTTNTATLADIELRIFETDANLSLGTLVDSSLSPVDNLQHTLTNLVPTNRYALELSLAGLDGQPGVDYAIAWQTTFTPVPEPCGVLLIAAAVGATWGWCVRRG